jgi:hypothetical protein
MTHMCRALFIVAALMLPATAAHAATMTFVGALSGANERPDPVPSPGSGLAIVVLDPTAETIQILATFSSLTSPTVAAHIHCCAPLNTNAGVATTVPAFVGFPLGVTFGAYMSPVFSLADALIYNPAFIAAQGGLRQAEAALIAGIIAGQSYFNIHTVNFPGGEIRGQLAAVAGVVPVPLPASIVLFGSALLGLGLLRRGKSIS